MYKIYENDLFRENARGHLCERDCLLFLAESIIDGNTEGKSLDISMQSAASEMPSGGTNTSTIVAAMMDPNNPTSDRFFEHLTDFRQSLQFARKTIKFEKVEY